MIEIAGRRFRSKAEVERRIRDIFARYARASDSDTEPLSGEDLDFARALLDRHPRAAEKCGPGVAEIRVQRVPRAKHQKRFLIVRAGGSLRDFSWRECLSPSSPAQQVREVCRALARPQIEAHREAFRREHPGGFRCPVTAAWVAPRDPAEIDHIPDFEELVLDWLRLNKLDAGSIEVVTDTGYEQPSRFADRSLEQSWMEYHRRFANLRVTSTEGHRKRHHWSKVPALFYRERKVWP